MENEEEEDDDNFASPIMICAVTRPFEQNPKEWQFIGKIVFTLKDRNFRREVRSVKNSFDFENYEPSYFCEQK